MKYTVSKEADKKIEEDVRTLTQIILKKVNPRAIIMFGGFGHKGGSFRKIGNKIVPLNDYDMYIITHKKVKEQKIKDIFAKIAEDEQRHADIVQKIIDIATDAL